jgi:hypothetical protein
MGRLDIHVLPILNFEEASLSTVIAKPAGNRHKQGMGHDTIEIESL